MDDHQLLADEPYLDVDGSAGGHRATEPHLSPGEAATQAVGLASLSDPERCCLVGDGDRVVGDDEGRFPRDLLDPAMKAVAGARKESARFEVEGRPLATRPRRLTVCP